MPRTTQDFCQRLVDQLSDRTGVEWTFGYLGNMYGLEGTPRFQDDRTWYAFCAHPGRCGTAADRIGGVSTDRLELLATMLQGAVALAVVLAEPR